MYKSLRSPDFEAITASVWSGDLLAQPSELSKWARMGKRFEAKASFQSFSIGRFSLVGVLGSRFGLVEGFTPVRPFT